MPDTPLLLCPYCGAAPKRKTHLDWHSVTCPTEGCPAHNSLFDTPDEATEAWNRRTPAQQPHATEELAV